MPAQKSAAQAATVSEPAPPQPMPDPVVATRREEPAEQAQPSPKEKTISARKKKEAHKPPAEEAAPLRAVAEAHAPAAAEPRHIGGFAAYGEDDVEQPPSVLVQISPEYPQRARRMSIEGRVEVRLVVDEAGAPQLCAVHRAVPAGYFEEAALAAARKTRFIPGKLRGRPVNTLVHLSFVFVLS
jgi:protein TonB